MGLRAFDTSHLEDLLYDLNSMRVMEIPGQMPPFWERSAIFFANLMSLFYGNEGETESLRREVGRIETYGGRLLPVIDLLFRGGNNLLVLEREPDRCLVDYLQTGLGLSLPEMAVISHERYKEFAHELLSDTDFSETDLHGISEHSAEWVDGFVTDDLLIGIAQSLGKSTISSLDGSKVGNNKFRLFEFLLERGLPTFDTEFAGNTAEVDKALTALASRGYSKAVVKAQIGASGVGMEIVQTNKTCDIPEYLFHEGPCIVQGWIEDGKDGITSIRSPSVQLFLNHDHVYLYDLTEQILSEDSIHQGNHAPPPYFKDHSGLKEELLTQAGRVGTWLHAQSYRGTASIDFVVLDRNGEVEVKVCEINARITGATYPAVLSRNFKPGGSWIMRNLKLSAAIPGDRVIKEIDDENCLFRPGSSHGVIPINFNYDTEGQVDKGQFLCIADSTEGCMELMDEIEEALPLKWSHDRD